MIDDTLALSATTMFRKGEEVTEKQVGNVTVTEVYGMPPLDSVLAQGFAAEDLVDVHFFMVGIKHAVDDPGDLIAKARFREEVDAYPEPDRLAGGPSYIEVGGVFGSQEIALRWMALGQGLGFWTVITPRLVGATGDEADDLAGSGFVMISPRRGAGS